MQVYDLKNAKKRQPGEIVDIPVSFGTFVKGNSKRYTTGFVKAEFVQYVDEDKAQIRYGTDLFIVSLTQVI
jgi:hypothetical protein